MLGILWILCACASGPARESLACAVSDCAMDTVFCKKFYQSIHDLEFDRKDVSLGARQDAVFFLEAVTNLTCHVNDIHHPLYNSAREYEMDLSSFMDWFRINKCTLTKAQADSLVRTYRGLLRH